MYFDDREQAGKILASELYRKYRYENCAVLAISLGGVLVGEVISQKLHCPISLLISETIDVPGEGIVLGSVSQTGQFSYNNNLSRFEINEYSGEFHNYLEERKQQLFQKINRMIGDGGLCNREMLQGRNIILVSDGFDDETLLGAVMDFLKPIRVERLVIAGPVASVTAVNHLHVIADELHILDVKKNYISTDHYYSSNLIPSQQEIIDRIQQNILKWQ